jgi:hypothetical protein
MREFAKKDRHTLLLVIAIVAAIWCVSAVMPRRWEVRIVYDDAADRAGPPKSLPGVDSAKEPAEAASAGQARQPVGNASIVTPDQFGMLGRSLTGTGSERFFPLAIQWRIGCGPINYNVLKQQFKAGSMATVLLTIEPIDPAYTSFSPVVYEISEESFFQGAPLMLSLPATTEALELGLFICSDTKKEGRCNTKQAFRAQPADLEGKTQSYAGDRLYFFSYLILADNALYTLNYSYAGNIYLKLGDYLKAQFAQTHQAEESVTRVVGLNKALRPRQLTLNEPMPKITLPMTHVACKSEFFRADY